VNNKAEYGNEIGSFGYMLKIDEPGFTTELASGQRVIFPLSLRLID